MRRRGFTLLELLIIIAILGMVSAVAVVSFSVGMEATRLRGAVRDVFAAMRQARSAALVTQKPAIITFSTDKTADGIVSRFAITSAELQTTHSLMTSAGRPPRSLDGYRTQGGAAEGGEGGDGGGQSVAEALFEPVAEDVMTGVGIKVVFAGEDVGEEDASNVDEARRSSVSTFSNTPFLLGMYAAERERRKSEAAAAAPPAGDDPGKPPVEAVEEDAHVLWQTNGRPHSACEIHVYIDGDDWRDGWLIRTDMFGAVEVVTGGGD